MKTKSVQIVSVQDWDELVTSTYGRLYCFQQQEGCLSRQTVYLTIPDECNDFDRTTVPEEINGDIMGVSFAAWLARDPEEWNGLKRDKSNLDMFWQRNFYPDVRKFDSFYPCQFKCLYSTPSF
jgi:hypothetical protein